MVGTTRRAAFGAIGSIAAAGLIAGHAARATATADIERHWLDLRVQMAKIESLDLDDIDAVSIHWERVGDAETRIVQTQDDSQRAHIIKLWVALNHCAGWMGLKHGDRILWTEDYDAMCAAYRGLDFDAKLIATVILSMRGEA